MNPRIDPTTTADVLRRTLRALADTGLELTGAPPRIAATGWESTIVRVSTDAGPVAVRVYTRHPPEVASRESQVMRTMATSGFPVPGIHGVSVDDNGRPALVMEFIDGRPASASGWSDNVIDTIVATMHRLHTIELLGQSDDPFGWSTGALERLIHQTPELVDVAGWIGDRIPEIEPIVGPVHMDLHPWNIIVDGSDTAWVVDWTSFQVSDVRFDLHWTRLLWEMFGAEPDARRFRERYLARADAAVGRDTAFFEVVSATRRLAMLLEMLETDGGFPFPIEAQIEASQVPLRWIRTHTGLELASLESRVEGHLPRGHAG